MSMNLISSSETRSKLILHPTLGEFQVLANPQGTKILQKTLCLENNLEKYGAINSPYITHLKSSSFDIQCEYFDMTLQEELEQRIQNNQKYTQQEILHFLQNISSAIAHLQEQKLVYGAIKCANIVKVGEEYKLLHPVLVKDLKKIPVIEKLPKISLQNNTTIITPDMLRAYHREVIDPVHEDFKDDVYALGLVVLDMMALHLETPIPIPKKLEQISFTYIPHLVRLVKKMLEEVLTLRIDPIACNLFVEKIYLKEKSKLVTKSTICTDSLIQSYPKENSNYTSIERNFKLQIPLLGTNPDLNFGKNWLHDETIISQSTDRPLESTSRTSLIKSRINFKGGHHRNNSAIDSIAPTNITSLSRLEEEEPTNLRQTRANYESPCRVSDEENPVTRRTGLSVNESLLFSGLPEEGVCAEFEDFETSRRDVLDRNFDGHIKNMTQSHAMFLSTPSRLQNAKNEATPKFKANALNGKNLHLENIQNFLTPIRPETERYSHGSTYYTTGRYSRLPRLNESSLLHDHIFKTPTNRDSHSKKVIFGKTPDNLDIEKLKKETEIAINHNNNSSLQMRQDTNSSTQSRDRRVLFRRTGPYANLKISTTTTANKKFNPPPQQPKSSVFCEGMCSKACQNDAQSPTIYIEGNKVIPHPEIRLTDSQEKLLKMIKQKVNHQHKEEIIPNIPVNIQPNTVTFNTKNSPQLYQGELKSGKKHGYGTLISEEGMIIYEGLWENDQYHGEGVLLNHNPQDPLKGTFSTVEKNSIIPSRQAGDWIKYSGSFFEGKWEGFGQLFAANGDKYVGQFKNDKAHGKGDFISQDGRVWQGEWQDNFLV